MQARKKTAQKQSQLQRGKASAQSDSEEEDVQSQAGLTQAQKHVQTLSGEDVDQKVNDLVKYLLIADQKKLPIKRQDINKHVLKEHSRGFNEFIQKAKDKLEKVFGIVLEEIEGKQQKTYILVNALHSDNDALHLSWSHEENKKMGVVMVMLSLITINEGVVSESLMFNSLKKLGLSTEHPHVVFGDVRRLVTQEFVRKGYVEFTRIPQTDPPVSEFKWGPRAKLETTPEKVMDFVKQHFNVRKGPKQQQNDVDGLGL